MFKNLRRKLFGIEKKLEEEIEERIEEELAAAKAAPPPAPAPRREPPRPSPAPERAVEKSSPPPAPLTPAELPRTYKEAKRAGLAEEAARKTVTVEERLAKELEAATRAQAAIEEVGGADTARVKLPEEKLEDLLWELELALMESDVAQPVVSAVKSSVREQLALTGLPRSNPIAAVEEVLKTAVRQVLKTGRLDFDAFIDARLKEGKRPVVIMFVGVNGTGKTTSIAKTAHRLQKRHISTVLAAGDTFRAGAIEQLSVHAERLGVKVVKHGPGSDPAAVAFDALEHARSRHKDVVLLDTAGRMQTNTNLMDEMAKIKRVARPDLILFVGDALAGNDAVEQAREFNRVVGIDGVILTKVDADAKGGAALSVAYTIGKPLLFVGVGQGYEDQVPFDAEWMVERLFARDGAEADA